MIIIDAKNLNEVNRFNTDNASSNLWCVRWLPNCIDIMFSPKHGFIEIWDTIKGTKKIQFNCNSLFTKLDISQMDFTYVIQLSNNCLSNYDKNNNNTYSIFIATTDSLYYCNIPSKTTVNDDEKNGITLLDTNEKEKENENINNFYIQYHTIACCGIDISTDSKFIAVGDLGCNFIIWKSTWKLI